MFVGKLRKEAEPTINGLESTERTGRDGRTINTAKIGRTRTEIPIGPDNKEIHPNRKSDESDDTPDEFDAPQDIVEEV